MAKTSASGYDRIIEKIFFDNFKSNDDSFIFVRRDIVEAKDELVPGLDLGGVDELVDASRAG